MTVVSPHQQLVRVQVQKRQAAEVTRRVQNLEAIGLVSNADVLMKPRASLKLISETETAEPGFVTMEEFLKAIAGAR